MNEVLKEKYEELDKIRLRSSESLSELSGVEGYINNLEKHSNLRKQNRGLENEYLRLAKKQNARLSDLKIMSEKNWLKFSRKKACLERTYRID